MKRVAFHFVRMSGITLVIVFCTFYPFLPGRYDGLAVTLSFMAQLLGVTGVLLVPIGALWWVHELRKRSRRRHNFQLQDREYIFALASVVAASIVAAIVALGAASSIGFSFGVIALGLWACAVGRLWPRLKALKREEAAAFQPAPLYLTLIPVAVLSLQVALAARATEFSRNRAIANSAQLLREIDHYRDTYGHYPQNLSAPNLDYKPAVVGIQQYHYAPSGEAYILYFELPAFHLTNPGTQEIVMYNQLDEHALPSHDSDILRWTPEQLAGRRGWHSVHDATTPHWKYFWFD